MIFIKSFLKLCLKTQDVALDLRETSENICQSCS